MSNTLATVSEVTPISVTRGNVDMSPIVEAIQAEATYDKENGVLVWNNAVSPIDLKTLGTFMLIGNVRTKLVFFQDDDVKVLRWRELIPHWEPGVIVCNMAPDFQKAYADKPDRLIGHGAIFEVALVQPTFARYFRHFPMDALILREANRIFTGLNRDRCKMVYVGHENMPYANAPGRLWKQAAEHAQAHAEATDRIKFILGKERK